MSSAKKPRVSDELSRSKNSEKDITRVLLDGFDWKGSQGQILIEEIIGHKINEVTLSCVIQIATIISKITDIKLDRNHKRSKLLLIKWFDQNRDAIQPLCKYIKIDFNNPNTINTDKKDNNDIDTKTNTKNSNFNDQDESNFFKCIPQDFDIYCEYDDEFECEYEF